MNNNKKTKKKRHNGEGSIRQKPNGRYEVRISGRDMETGKSTRISKYADTLDEAVDIQHALSVAMVQTPQYLQNNTTVGEWLDNWLTTYSSTRSSSPPIRAMKPMSASISNRRSALSS